MIQFYPEYYKLFVFPEYHVPGTVLILIKHYEVDTATIFIFQAKKLKPREVVTFPNPQTYEVKELPLKFSSVLVILEKGKLSPRSDQLFFPGYTAT